MKLPNFVTATDDENTAVWWRWISAESVFDPLIIAVLSTRDSIRAYVHSVSVSISKMFARTTVSFMVYVVVFGAASISAAIFITPLLILSMLFSGLVMLFSSLSYTTFRMASSKYNSTVLLLNRLLRELANNIPPGVGIVETVDIHKKRDASDVATFKQKYTPSVLVQAWDLMWSCLPKKKAATTTVPTDTAAAVTIAVPVEAPDAFQLEMIGPGAPVVYDEDPEEQPAEHEANLAESTIDQVGDSVVFTPQENHVGEHNE